MDVITQVAMQKEEETGYYAKNKMYLEMNGFV